ERNTAAVSQVRAVANGTGAARPATSIPPPTIAPARGTNRCASTIKRLLKPMQRVAHDPCARSRNVFMACQRKGSRITMSYYQHPLDVTTLSSWNVLEEHRLAMQHFNMREAFAADPAR